MQRRRIGTTDLEVFPLCLGGNVFGWTCDETQSFAVLDAFAAAGGNFIDTADAYSSWVPGHAGGESETIIGRWMRSRGNRRRVMVATKVGYLPALKGLAPTTLRAAVDGSLTRLGTDVIDLYYAHFDDRDTPLEDTLRAFDEIVRAGKVRYIAASNYTAPRLAEALAISKRDGLAPYVALQPNYNLVHRADYEGELRDVCVRAGLSCLPYFALASGFLTGKYRAGQAVESARAAGVKKYETPEGARILDALERVARAHDTTMSAVALAWLCADETIAAPIASARTPGQLADLLPSVELRLTREELALLTTG
jgi:aryl-alcohol dehydrogenase-like predicted oxidoreductase